MLRKRAAILGSLLLLPWLFLILLIPVFLPLLCVSANHILLPFLIMFLFSLCIVVGLKTYFSFDVAKNRSIKPENNRLWVVLIILTGIIGITIYWYLKIVKPVFIM